MLLFFERMETQGLATWEDCGVAAWLAHMQDLETGPQVIFGWLNGV